MNNNYPDKVEEMVLKWKEMLGLQDWAIKFRFNCTPEEMSVKGVSGCTEWNETIKAARIEIIDPKYYGDRVVDFNFEKTLVHELLHLKLSFWCQEEYTVSDRLMHQVIDDLARAFVWCSQKKGGCDDKQDVQRQN